MPIFPDPNGGSMVVANEQEAIARGWTPSMGSFGANSYPNGTGGGGGGAPAAPPQVVPQGFDAGAFAGALQNSLGPMFSQVSGFERDKLKQENDQFLQQLQLGRDKLERLGIPELQIRQQLANLEAEHTRRMDTLAEEIQRGQLGLQRELGMGQLGVDRGALGLQYLQYASQLAGTDPFSYSDFQRGAQQRGDVPMFLRALAANQRMPTFQGAGQTPTPLSGSFTIPQQQQLATDDRMAVQKAMEERLGTAGWRNFEFENALGRGAGLEDAVRAGGGNAQDIPQTPGVQAVRAAQQGIPLAFQQGVGGLGGYNTDRALGFVEAIGSQGGHKLPTGSLEQLNPGEMTSFAAGLGKAGYSVPDWLRQYEKSRSPQRAATGSVLSY